jgi:hypothetical protein
MKCRFDSEGLFWVDLPPPDVERKTKIVEKRTPPARTWEVEGYIPQVVDTQEYLLFSDDELVEAAISRDWFFFDIECYSNYFLVSFKSKSSARVVYFEMYEGHPLDNAKLAWVVKNYCLVGFNSRGYDMPMLQVALGGASCAELKVLSDRIIADEGPAWQLIKHAATGDEAPNHIDLIEVAPLDASLKLYGGRLHARTMWDLPFAPSTVLTHEQMAVVCKYCINDLDLTEALYYGLEDQIALRAALSVEYGKDLRSLSDAQIAESVITGELRKRGVKVDRVEVAPGTVLKYKAPDFIKFKTPYMVRVLELIESLDFVVNEAGYCEAPKELEELVVEIADGKYQMGMGGLHSCEEQVAHKADELFSLIDRDVASYYPTIILNCKLYPLHLGPEFLDVYRTIVDRRLAAKRAKNKVVADSLKITINGTFGKLGSKWSALYSPDLMFKVTITGQLGLLMLIERLELGQIRVISANTDGVVTKVPTHLENAADGIVKEWERETGFDTEEAEYAALYSRDINNYIAIKKNGSTKNKGAFANPWADTASSIFRMHKNPTTTVCIEAVEKYLQGKSSIEDSIRGCSDVRKFISIRTVKGGAVKDGAYLGKAIRWYYAVDCEGEIIYASSGNAVAKTTGAKPLMTLPFDLPADVDYAWYEQEATRMLKDLGIN